MSGYLAMYKIVFQRAASKQLLKVPTTDRQRIVDKLYTLAKDPNDRRLDVTKKSGEPGYRLRVGNCRVIFYRQDSLNIIEVQKIGPRGGVDK